MFYITNFIIVTNFWRIECNFGMSAIFPWCLGMLHYVVCTYILKGAVQIEIASDNVLNELCK